MYKTSARIDAFFEEHLPEAKNADTAFSALKMLYELIDDKGFEPPKYEKLNEFGTLADDIYDELYELNYM